MIYCPQKNDAGGNRMRFHKLLALVLVLVLLVPMAAFATPEQDLTAQVQKLPSQDEAKTMTQAEQKALYEKLDALWDQLDAMDEATAKALEATQAYKTLTGLTQLLNDLQVSTPLWADCSSFVLIGDNLTDGEDYAYAPDQGELVIKGSKDITITLGQDIANTTDCLRLTGTGRVTLVDVHISAPEGKIPLTIEKDAILRFRRENSLTAKNQPAIVSAGSLTLSGQGTLSAQGGTDSDGLQAKSITIESGTLTITGGTGQQGDVEVVSGNGGNAVTADSLTITGGSVRLVPGKAGEDGGHGTGTDGMASTSTPTAEKQELALTALTLIDEAQVVVPGISVTQLTLSEGTRYGCAGMVTDDAGTLYLYLPKDSAALGVSSEDTNYTGSVAAGEAGILAQQEQQESTEPSTQPTETEPKPTETEPKPTQTEPEETKPKPTEPEKKSQTAPKAAVESYTSNSVTLKKLSGGHGQVEYSYGFNAKAPETNWVTTRIFVDLEPGETYYFFARYSGDDAYLPSPAGTPVKLTLSKALSTMQVQVPDVTATYTGKAIKISPSIPSGAKIYYWDDETQDYSLTTFPSYIKVGRYQTDYLVQKEGYEDVAGVVTVQITKATPKITLADATKDYTGSGVPMGGAKVTGVNGENFKGAVTYTYYTNGECTLGETTTPPTKPGTYYVLATIDSSSNYTSAVSNTAKLVIRSTSTSSTTATSATQPTTAKTTYTVTASAGTGGSVSPSGAQKVESGSNISFAATPDKGYEVEEIKVDGKSMGSVAVYTFRNVTGAHTVEFTFRKTVAETTAPAQEETTVPTTQAPATQPTTAPTSAPTTQPELPQDPENSKGGIPIIVPILLVVLAFAAIGGAVFIYKKFDE